MPTTLRTPSRDELVALNRQTHDGDGTVLKADVLDGIAAMQHLAFDYGVKDLDDSVDLGMAFAWCLVNEHVFLDGNKSTATLALEWVLNNDGRAFTVPKDPTIIGIVNDLYDTGLERIAAGVAEIRQYVR